jgi:hypothetical protein
MLGRNYNMGRINKGSNNCLKKIVKNIVRIRRRIIVFCLVILFIAASFFTLALYLYKDDPVDAEVLVAEGWLPEDALNEAKKIYYSGRYKMLVITGINLPDAVNMHSFGKLVFDLEEYTSIKPGSQVTTVGINAFGRKVGGEFPHFRLFVNDSLTGNAYVARRGNDYDFPVSIRKKDIKTITVEYDNDKFTYWRDRNLYVNYISIDSLKLPARSKHVLYNMNKPGNYRQLEPRFASYADYSAYILKTLGFKDSIIAITAYDTRIGRTYSSALYFKEWYRSSSFRGSPVNIVSVGHHTRRTWMTYKKVLGRDADIGVILIDNAEYNKYNWWKSAKGIRNTIDETASYIYTALVLPFVSKDLKCR